MAGIEERGLGSGNAIGAGDVIVAIVADSTGWIY